MNSKAVCALIAVLTLTGVAGCSAASAAQSGTPAAACVREPAPLSTVPDAHSVRPRGLWAI